MSSEAKKMQPQRGSSDPKSWHGGDSQAKGLLRHGSSVREKNPLDVMVWRSHERAKWLSWTKAGTSPFRNTFFKQSAGGRIHAARVGKYTHADGNVY